MVAISASLAMQGCQVIAEAVILVPIERIAKKADEETRRRDALRECQTWIAEDDGKKYQCSHCPVPVGEWTTASCRETDRASLKPPPPANDADPSAPPLPTKNLFTAEEVFPANDAAGSVPPIRWKDTPPVIEADRLDDQWHMSEMHGAFLFGGGGGSLLGLMPAGPLPPTPSLTASFGLRYRPEWIGVQIEGEMNAAGQAGYFGALISVPVRIQETAFYALPGVGVFVSPSSACENCLGFAARLALGYEFRLRPRFGISLEAGVLYGYGFDGHTHLIAPTGRVGGVVHW